MPIVVVLEAPADETTMADPPGATSTDRAMVRGRGLVHSTVRQESRPDTLHPTYNMDVMAVLLHADIT